MKARRNKGKQLLPRFRVVCGEDIALGPGKAELLELIDKTGSISEAARQMGMSYNRAWLLTNAMNECFKAPVVVPLRGGAAGGGAGLSETGRRALKMYRQLEQQSLKASAETWDELQNLLR